MYFLGRLEVPFDVAEVWAIDMASVKVCDGAGDTVRVGGVPSPASSRWNRAFFMGLNSWSSGEAYALSGPAVSAMAGVKVDMSGST